MKKIVIISIILLFTGCTLKNSDNLSNSIDINIEANLEASITVGDKITGTGYETIILGVFRVPGTRYSAHGVTTDATSTSKNLGYMPISYALNFIDYAKGEAVHDALTSSNADLIISPQFIITEENFLLYKTIKCEVNGYKGTIKNIK